MKDSKYASILVFVQPQEICFDSEWILMFNLCLRLENGDVEF